ncbi:unnamed protein product [Ostreobium quekettii]|uniref:Phosphoesterase n=1 Tax=Ostreobium quekettii TaxID=121088 RepID=A0A8S1J9M8_9CHLO|nr:unnamed protein product [Ostreobium quekettii]|eukprot:evm.model.scf_2282.3 EVM.evm.TU.scf_2282.3   scf_2282:19581-21711(+)
MQSVVCYHYPCLDGIFSALAAYLHHREVGRRVRFFPMKVYAPPEGPEALRLRGHEHVFLLDYAGPRGFAVEVAKVAKRVTVLDHHKTAAESLPDVEGRPSNLEVVLDISRSAATIALDYFRPQKIDRKLWEMFRFVEDADLWRWRFADSKAFRSGVAAQKIKFDVNENPRIFDQLLQLDPCQVIQVGRTRLEDEQKIMDTVLKESFEVAIGGHVGLANGWGSCLAVRADDVRQLRSELGNRLADISQSRGLRAMGLVAYFEPDLQDHSKIKCSFRSSGDEDTTVITRAFDGGGHANASSCMVDFEQFQSWRV